MASPSLLRMLCNVRLRRLRVVRVSVIAAYLVLAFVFVVAVFVRVERQSNDGGGGGGNGLPWEADQGEMMCPLKGGKWERKGNEYVMSYLATNRITISKEPSNSSPELNLRPRRNARSVAAPANRL